ncbi:class I SAM-dependent methyltransferase [Nocardia sp. NPDC048505]|uniref:class I SAM-dependent methyltransferase n=1 Tax=unclassified Nocardia TaxID=2637762 RepID=UPI0033EBFC61
MSGMFTGTAWHYARYRPGYPPEFIDDTVRTLHLDRHSRVLDLGCGTGQLSVPLARRTGEVVGVDPEPEMLVEAMRYATSTGVTNVRWTQASSADLPASLGRFDVVTMGRSFHWMIRENVLAVLHGMVEDRGSLVIANDSCLVCPITEWQRAIEEIQNRHLPGGRPTVPVEATPHDEILRRSAFAKVERRSYEFQRLWTIEQVIGYLYSTSLPLRRLLPSRTLFEQEVTRTLAAISPDGLLVEPVTLEVFIATRP